MKKGKRSNSLCDAKGDDLLGNSQALWTYVVVSVNKYVKKIVLSYLVLQSGDEQSGDGRIGTLSDEFA